jgi:hypothetical protein
MGVIVINFSVASSILCGSSGTIRAQLCLLHYSDQTHWENELDCSDVVQDDNQS